MEMIVGIAMRFFALTAIVLSVIGVWYMVRLVTISILMSIMFKRRSSILMHPRRLGSIVDMVGTGVVLLITWSMVSSHDPAIEIRAMATVVIIIYVYMFVDRSEYQPPMGDPTSREFVESIGLTALCVWPLILIINWIASYYVPA